MNYFKAILMAVFVLLNNGVSAQDTFSITAIDTVTGEVGSAGASCVAGSLILSDVHPGVGVIHCQASYLAGNQNYARSLMNMGLSPQQIIDSLVAHDVQNNPGVRQYGIVDFRNGIPRTAGYTGVNCINYKSHKLGRNYTIQGNILSGQLVLDSMEARFLRTPGTLADKLMAALQGAKMPGADTRCLNQGTSSKSAFLRIARPGDTLGTLYLHLNVNNTAFGVEPIDSLQALYNQWITTGVNSIGLIVPDVFSLYQNYPNPFNPVTKIKFDIPLSAHSSVGAIHESPVRLAIYDVSGRLITILAEGIFRPGSYEAQWDASGFPSGVYYYKLETTAFTDVKKMVLVK
jgi:uncharacterized Ntn-hydrolase superfamily protein